MGTPFDHYNIILAIATFYKLYYCVAQKFDREKLMNDCYYYGVFMNGINQTMIVLLEYIDHLLQIKCRNIVFTPIAELFPIMLNAFSYPLSIIIDWILSETL